MAIDQVPLARLMQSVEAGRSEIGALCFLIWDILITTDQEVRVVPPFVLIYARLITNAGHPHMAVGPIINDISRGAKIPPQNAISAAETTVPVYSILFRRGAHVCTLLRLPRCNADFPPES